MNHRHIQPVGPKSGGGVQHEGERQLQAVPGHELEGNGLADLVTRVAGP